MFFSLDHCQPLDRPLPHPPHSQHVYPTYHPGGLFVEVTRSPASLAFLSRRRKRHVPFIFSFYPMSNAWIHSATLLRVPPKKTRILYPMNTSTLLHRTLIRNNQLLQYILPQESMGTTGHVSASSFVLPNSLCTLQLSTHILVLRTSVRDTYNVIHSAMCSLPYCTKLS
jgi:hypothetical protein